MQWLQLAMQKSTLLNKYTSVHKLKLYHADVFKHSNSIPFSISSCYLHGMRTNLVFVFVHILLL